MENSQPIFSIEMLPNGDTPPAIPRLSLPQVMPAQVIAKRQHSYNVNTLLHQKALQMTPFPQTPITPRLSEPATRQALILHEKQDTSSAFLESGPQVPFSTTRFDFSRSLRSSVTYIPRSMTRHKEPNMIDALIACCTLIVIGLVLLTILYYFNL